jgi:hypothetical protein
LPGPKHRLFRRQRQVPIPNRDILNLVILNRAIRRLAILSLVIRSKEIIPHPDTPNKEAIRRGAIPHLEIPKEAILLPVIPRRGPVPVTRSSKTSRVR